MLNPLTLSALRPFATCRKCTFAKATHNTLTPHPPQCLLLPPAVNGEVPRVQSGDFCQAWTPKNGKVAKEAVRILKKRGTCKEDSRLLQDLLDLDALATSPTDEL